MRVLFLDFDGVLHAVPCEGPGSADSTDVFCWFDILVSLLAPHKDVFLVVHSTWRYAHTPDEIGDMLGVLNGRYLGVTPRGQRYEAIRWWLSQNKTLSHCILDDMPDEFGTPPPAELIVCDPLEGISGFEAQPQLSRWLETT